MKHAKSAQLEAVPTKSRFIGIETEGRKYLFIFRIHHKKELPNVGLLAAKRRAR